LPAWDGRDRLEALARRVSDNDVLVRGSRRWMLALAALWAGLTGRHDNSVAPILVSSARGCLKSTFCRSLMPEPLRRYYTDEVDKYPASQMPRLKNLMQMADLNLCKAYQRNCARCCPSPRGGRDLQSFNPAAMRRTNPNFFSQKLAPLGFRRQRGHYNTYYPVVFLTGTLAQVNSDE
jgi:hypothetical protein